MLSDFKANCTPFDFGWDFTPHPAEELPIPLVGIKGAYF